MALSLPSAATGDAPPPQGFPADIVRAAQGCEACVDYGPLVSTREGNYSAHLPYHSPDAAQALRRHFPGLEGPGGLILDATAGVGGDSLHFLHTFPHVRVTAVEAAAENWEALRHNLAVAGFAPRSEAVCANFLSYARRRAAGSAREATLVYFDPPWGGRGKWKDAPPPLALEAPVWASRAPEGRVPLSAAIDQAFLLGVAPHAVAKVPPNFDVAGFEREMRAARVLAREPVHKRTPYLREGEEPPLAYWLLILAADRPDGTDAPPRRRGRGGPARGEPREGRHAFSPPNSGRR